MLPTRAPITLYVPSTIDDERSKTATQTVKIDDEESAPPFEVRYTNCTTQSAKEAFDEQWLEYSPLTAAEISMNSTTRKEAKAEIHERTKDVLRKLGFQPTLQL